MNWQLLWLGCLLPMTVSRQALGPAEKEAAVDYLLQYGYLQKPLEGPDDFRPEEITEALRTFQEASELPVSGQMDDATRVRMRQPRCGLEDPFNQKTLKYLLLGRWRKKHLTFRILNLPSTLPAHTARAALLQAFQYWSNVTPLTFQEVWAGRADIRLSFHGRQSLYCSKTFDGPGRVLAHADIPEMGSVHFDEDELWTEGTYRGVNLRIIAAHELGHALGLGHSRYTQALMAPVYAGYRPHFKLHPDDVAGIQALYGKKSPETGDEEVEELEPPTVLPVPTKPSPMPDPCSGELDAMMLGPRGKTYAFKGDYVWTVTDSGLGPLFRVSALWEGLPGNLDAAVYSPRTQWIHFFKGIRTYHDGCDLKPSESPGVMAQKHPGGRGLCGAHHGGGASFRTLGSSVDPDILSFSGLRDSAGTALNGTRSLTEHSDPRYTQPPNPAHWSDPSHGPPRGPGPPRDGEDPDQSEASSEESGVDQELPKENEIGYQEDGNPSFLSIPLACNCQGTTGIPEGPYSEGGDSPSSNFCHHCTSPALGDEELEEEYDDEEPLKFPSDFSRVPSGKKPPPRRQRHRFPTKEDTREGGRRDPRSPGRHRLGRKRSQADRRRGLGLWGAEELCQLGQAGFWWLIELLVLVGEYVETCGHLIYACRQLKGSDLDLFRVWVGVWAERLGTWAQVMFQLLSQGFCCGAGLFTHFLRLLGALLLLALALLLGCVQLGWRFLVGLGNWLGWRGKATWLLSWLDSPALQRCLTLLRDSRLWQQLVRIVHWGWLDLPWVKQRTNRQGNAPGASGRYCQPEQEVARLLTMAGVPEDELNPFRVLGVEATASDVELKKAYRQLAVMVHPDKNHHPRAEEAFKVLRAAWDIVSNPERRKEYEMKRMAENELSRSVNEFLSKLQDDLKEAMNTMMCSRCQGKHRRFEMDREPKSARYCAECNRLHPAEEGDFWAESSMLGLKITYFALMDGKVYDITEWAGCQRVGISPDTHRVPYHISFGSRIPGTSGRQRATPDAPPPADLQDFLSRIFQVPPGQMSNGNFFAAPQPGPGATAASKPNSTVPKGEAKPKRRKKVRRPFQR